MGDMMSLKDVIKKKILGYRATSKSYIQHLRQIGMSIGDNVVLYRPFNTTIDEQNPHMLTIGNHVMITGPATILSHDYSWCVIKGKYGDITGNQRKTIIGNNVFIGWGATILGGSCIGDNVIIGAGAVVSGEVESDSVYSGNPAKKLMSLEDFYKKRLNKQVDEAVEFVREYKKRYGRYPEEEQMKEYFFLFADEHNLCPKFDSQLRLIGNRKQSIEVMKRRRMFNGYEDFLNYCKNNIRLEK